MGELEGRLLDARNRIDSLLRDTRTGSPRGTSLLGIMAIVHDLHTYVVEQTAERIKGR
jgi:hypothetical protein